MIFSGVEQDPTNYYAASIKEKVDNVNNERMSVAEERNLPMRSGRDGQTVDEINALQASLSVPLPLFSFTRVIASSNAIDTPANVS